MYGCAWCIYCLEITSAYLEMWLCQVLHQWDLGPGCDPCILAVFSVSTIDFFFFEVRERKYLGKKLFPFDMSKRSLREWVVTAATAATGEF